MKIPLVTVVITNYNYGKYITKAAKSVLSQTYKNVELLIINDGSTDNSDEIIKELILKNQGMNIRYVNRSNKGVVYTRNEGIRLAKGEYLCFLDADDYFDRDYISKGLKIIEESGADIVYPNWHYVGEWLGRPDTNFPEFDTKLLQLQRLHVSPASLMRKQALSGHEFEVEKVAEDWDFFIGLSLAGKKFKLAKNSYINYRIRQGTRGSRNDPKEDTKCFVEILEKYKAIYGDKVIDPNKLISERHPGVIKRLLSRGLIRRVFESIKRDGLMKTTVKISRRALSRIVVFRMIARKFINRRYYMGLSMSNINTTPKVRVAVVIHLFYPELWTIIRDKLTLIGEPFDLFVSVPKEHGSLVLEKAGKHHRATNLVVVPNRGRDVLPFLVVCRMIGEHKQYQYLLKLHSKKSPHREDGDKWLNDLLDQLLPKKNKELTAALRNRTTGVVGPSAHVVSLSRYMGNNKDHMVHVMEQITDKNTIDTILLNKERFPFFGGTMFWCTMDFIRPILLSDLCPADFSPENKQVDGTMAHALERLLGGTLHLITKKNMYTVSKTGAVNELSKRSYTAKYKFVE